MAEAALYDEDGGSGRSAQLSGRHNIDMRIKLRPKVPNLTPSPFTLYTRSFIRLMPVSQLTLARGHKIQFKMLSAFTVQYGTSESPMLLHGNPWQDVLEKIPTWFG